MSLDELRKVFIPESSANTARILTLPSGVTKTLATELVAELPLDSLVSELAVATSKLVGTKLLTSALRPSDYADMNDLPDSLLERIIEELASKPEVFFKTFQETLKLQG